MIDTRRVRHMTHMAVDEKYNAKEYISAGQFAKRDYISLMKVIAFLAGTIAYIVIAGVFCFILFSMVFTNVTFVISSSAAIVVIAGYILHQFYYMRVAVVNIEEKYARSRERFDRLKSDYMELDEMYRESED